MGDEKSKVPWDQRLAEHMARQSWEAANDPTRLRRNPPVRTQIKSPYFWVAILVGPVAFAIVDTVRQGWAYGVAAALYIGGLVASARARRDSLRE
jgi:hypothetical protein